MVSEIGFNRKGQTIYGNGFYYTPSVVPSCVTRSGSRRVGENVIVHLLVNAITHIYLTNYSRLNLNSWLHPSYNHGLNISSTVQNRQKIINYAMIGIVN